MPAVASACCHCANRRCLLGLDEDRVERGLIGLQRDDAAVDQADHRRQLGEGCIGQRELGEARGDVGTLRRLGSEAGQLLAVRPIAGTRARPGRPRWPERCRVS